MNSDNLDNNLISNYLSGDRESLDILIHKYLKPIYNFSYSYVKDGTIAEDTTQEVFVKVWKNIHKFDPQRTRKKHLKLLDLGQKSHALYQTNGESFGSGFKTWIFAIAKNTCLDYLRTKKTISFSLFSTNEGGNILEDTVKDMSPLPQEILELSEIRKSLNLTMLQLSPKYQEILSLHYNKEFKFREIADFTGISLNTVKSQHRRALIALKKLLS